MLWWGMKRETYRRFAYIETCLHWEGGVTARKLGDTFDIARQNAHKVIDAYRELHPENIRYNASHKCHEITENFVAKYINLKAGRYLDYLRGNSLANRYWMDEEWSALLVHDVDALYRPYLDANIVSKLVSAIQNQSALELDYQAKAGHQYFTVAPNQLVYANRRYHLRAYCYDWDKFIDLVPSRVLGVKPSDEDWVSSDEDKEWNAYVDLKFIPNADLPESLRETLLLDFRLEDDEVYTIKTRKALEHYVLREMEQLDWNHHIPLWSQST